MPVLKWNRQKNNIGKKSKKKYQRNNVLFAKAKFMW